MDAFQPGSIVRYDYGHTTRPLFVLVLEPKENLNQRVACFVGAVLLNLMPLDEAFPVKPGYVENEWSEFNFHLSSWEELQAFLPQKQSV